MLENVHNNAMWKKTWKQHRGWSRTPLFSMCIIQKTLESNTLIAYYHLALCGLETTGNFILFFELFWFCQTLFNVYLELSSSVKYVFKSHLSFEDVIHTHTLTHIYIQENITQPKKNEIMPLEATQMVLHIIILSEVNQSEKDKYHLISLIRGI